MVVHACIAVVPKCNNAKFFAQATYVTCVPRLTAIAWVHVENEDELRGLKSLSTIV